MTSKRTSRAPKANTEQIASVLAVLMDHRNEYLRRDTIAEITGIHERLVRAAIADLVAVGDVAVVPDRRVGGYSLTDRPEDIDREIRHLQSQIRNTENRIAALDRIAAEMRNANDRAASDVK